ncbi:MAG TPA: hypothetical protein VFB99_14125, partial [Vicinamibacterales bacterium]|nr:hypothetical protein [Vicinamibacterales bacterium]
RLIARVAWHCSTQIFSNRMGSILWRSATPSARAVAPAGVAVVVCTRRRRGHLRQSKFVGLREDEKATEVVRE